MSSVPSLSAEELRAVFVPAPGTQELVGVEVETAPLDLATGQSVGFGGPRGLQAFLTAARDRLAAEPVVERGNLVGLLLADGSQVSLENGGAVEFSSAPAATVAAVVHATRTSLVALGTVAAEYGFVLVPGANYPFSTLSDVRWVPNARGEFMRRYFAAQGAPSAFAQQVMGLSLSTQVTFDYLNETDMVEKLRMQAAVSTVAAALFVNSPLDAGRPSGELSRRMRYFSRFAPERTRVLPPTLGEVSVDRFVDWALTLPMIYRKQHDHGCGPAPDRPFGDLLRHGFDDGTWPNAGDWSAHLAQIYPDVRLRGTLELRAVDGPPYPAFAAVPAFWAGLTYHRPSRIAAWELTRDATLADHRASLDDITVRGLDAEFCGQPVRPLAAELLRLSAAGLRARVDAGLEHAEALTYLDPLHEIIATGDTFAHQALRAWEQARHRPERVLPAWAVPATPA